MAQIQQMLQDTADPGDGFDRGSGYGLLDVAKFLAEALRLPA